MSSSDILRDLLINNWNSANTDGITPTILKVINTPRPKNTLQKDFITIHTTSVTFENPGLGDHTIAHETHNMRIYLDTQDKTGDAHTQKDVSEIKKILFSNRTTNPTYLINPFGQEQDLSDKTRLIFRFVFDVKIIYYCQDQAV